MPYSSRGERCSPRLLHPLNGSLAIDTPSCVRHPLVAEEMDKSGWDEEQLDRSSIATAAFDTTYTARSTKPNSRFLLSRPWGRTDHLVVMAGEQLIYYIALQFVRVLVFVKRGVNRPAA